MPRRSAEAAAETRRAILAVARSGFAARGFAGSSADEIARRVGVTRGALYHHFGDKRALFAAVFEQLEAELDAAARRAALDAESPDPLERFLAGARAYLEFAARRDYQRVAQVEARAVLGEEAWRARAGRPGLERVERALAHLIRHGRIRSQPIRALAVLVHGGLHEAAAALARDEPGVALETALDALRGLLDPTSAPRTT